MLGFSLVSLSIAGGVKEVQSNCRKPSFWELGGVGKWGLRGGKKNLGGGWRYLGASMWEGLCGMINSRRKAGL